MKGKHKIIVSTKRLKYEFELQRNLTIIQGDSATGKTTLVDMIRDFVNNPSGSYSGLESKRESLESKVDDAKDALSW